MPCQSWFWAEEKATHYPAKLSCIGPTSTIASTATTLEANDIFGGAVKLYPAITPIGENMGVDSATVFITPCTILVGVVMGGTIQASPKADKQLIGSNWAEGDDDGVGAGTGIAGVALQLKANLTLGGFVVGADFKHG